MLIRRLFVKGFRSIQAEAIDFANPLLLVGKNGAGKSNVADIFAFLAEIATLPLQTVFNSRGGLNSVRHKTGKSTPSIGMAVEFDHFPAYNSSGMVEATGRYAFEIQPQPRFGMEVAREQCVVTMPDAGTFWYDRTGSTIQSNLEVLSSLSRVSWLEPSSFLLPVAAIGPLGFVQQALKRMRVYSIEPWKLREMQDPDTGETLRSDGGNAASVLNHIENLARSL